MLEEERQFVKDEDTESSLDVEESSGSENEGRKKKNPLIKSEGHYNEQSLAIEYSPTHHRRWTEEEDLKLKDAMQIYPFGDWQSISSFVSTRSAMQCKNRHGHWLMYKIDDSTDNFSKITPTKSNVSLKRKAADKIKSCGISTEPFLSDKIPSDFSTMTSYPKPIDFEFQSDKIHPFEVFHCSEWFPDIEKAHDSLSKRLNPNKTPARYLKIRNHICKLWSDSKPKFISKSAIRKGLQKEGDVHALSRVWEFLVEQEFINLGISVQRKPNSQKVVEEEEEIVFHSVSSDFKRKRRVRAENGEWIDESEIEGRVIDHAALEEADLKRKKHRKRRLVQNGSHYDPFQLVTPKSYSTAYPADFEVYISCESMVFCHFVYKPHWLILSYRH